jgi:seryl-tRNA synthetase
MTIDDATAFDPDEFYAALVAHKLIIPVGVPGAFGRSAIFEDILERFNALVSAHSADDDAQIMTFPPVISRQLLEKTGYLDSFPHLCGTIFSFNGDERQARELSRRVTEKEDWSSTQSMGELVLNPAACYPVYPSFTGILPAEGRTVTMLHWVFRNEPSNEPTRMQSFRVREFVRAGTEAQVSSWRDMWLERSLGIFSKLGLPAHSDIATDPFFGRAGKLMADSQRKNELKFEINIPVISTTAPTACCSFNCHQDHFSTPFGIKTHHGDVASTACVGLGLERIVMALLKTHGLDPTRWPATVRKHLWP